MQFYWEFVGSFYSGVSLPVPIDPLRGFQLFELLDRSIVVAAFDSVDRNDCFSYSGRIPRGALAKCSLHLRDNLHTYKLRIAVWHHSIRGPPLRDDYMEVSQVREMVGLGFQLGMHGHQHVSEATTQFIYLNEVQSMGVVSAGSLCAGARELPRGVNRQYNLVVLDNDLRRARVHIREIVDGEQFSGKRNGAFLQGFSELSWQPATDVAGRPVDATAANNRRSVMQAEESQHAGRPLDAFALLRGLKLAPGSHERKIAIQSLQMSREWKTLIDTIGTPETVEESVFLVSALLNCGLLDQAASALGAIDELDATTRSALSEQINLRRMMRAQ